MRGHALLVLAVIACLLLVGVASVSAFPNREARIVSGERASDARDGTRVEVEGPVRLVGSEPFSDLVITDEYGNDWYLVGEIAAIEAFEQQRVLVQGVLSRRKLTLANGKDLGERLELDGIELVEPRP